MTDDEEEGRVLFFEIDGLTRIVRDCHDIDELEVVVGFTHCPICGGPRAYENGNSHLDHDSRYTGQIH